MQGLIIENLTVRFGAFKAIDNVSINVPPGSVVGLVGESGSGKSTIGRAASFMTPYSGKISLDGKVVSSGDLKYLRSRMQMVFQDPTASLNPRMRVGDSIQEAIKVNRAMVPGEVGHYLDMVHLNKELADRYPYELSGGQRQRVAIARVLAVKPSYIILDEVTSALDVSAQAAILNLLRELQSKLGLSYLFISHNLDTVRFMCDRIAVMYLGRIVEENDAETFFQNPQHPYSRALLAAVPRLGVRMDHAPLTGDIMERPRNATGCRFQDRCPAGPKFKPDRDICRSRDPQDLMKTRGYACHF
ncbi:oligopeptide/dipeptide ABC transporter ATP-binding protein [Sinisalibacter aestuarii]|uniref:Dipeptide/oligopeptide/nickel ABC transporter ATP-binding protein n=1 Tax=Sinisalibacter aestuarii TaxID=2949426 RepID=A0ABQ5LY64_9RHOB|nr:oligopeptide/dipeptide ABC transporter ATP-binding protein [Sinisalibacter aestuarii]GKY89889.1 dipeptide/oligopeptide/nickel ABC transporter ATP-binding protein [Sinisalibacter aestuarii]